MRPGITGKELRAIRDKLDDSSVEELRSMLYLQKLEIKQLRYRHHILRKALTDINAIVDPTPDDLRGPASRVVDVLYLSVDALNADYEWEKEKDDERSI